MTSTEKVKQFLRHRLQSKVVDVHTRQLRYFVVLADELNFTRAARRLFVTQQALSAQIRRLERQVGADLFRRTTRCVELTPAGRAFFDEALLAVAACDRAAEAVRIVARGKKGVLSIGFVTGAALELTPLILEAFEERERHVDVRLREYRFDDPSAGLHAGEVDVAFVRLPLESRGLRLERLFTEPRVAMLPANHALAGRRSLSFAEIQHEPITALPSGDPVWNGFWLASEERNGSPPKIAMEASSLEEELGAVAAGNAITITAAAASRYYPRPGVVYIPITDIAGSTCAVGWRQESESDLVRSFTETALAVCTQDTDTLRAIEHPW
jgi:DNA-binding transcriptional LysR family regulator